MHDGASAVSGPSTGWRIARPVAALALLAFVAYWVGPQNLREQLGALGPGWFGAAVAMAIGANAVSAWRWTRLARALDLRAPFGALASAYAQGITVNVLLPGATLGGDALRSLRLANLGNPLGASALSVALDRASGLWVLCLLSLIAVAAWLAFAPTPLPASLDPRAFGLYLAALLLAASAPWWPWHRIVGAAPRGRIGAALARWHELIAARRPALVRSLLPSLAVQLLSATTLWLCAHAVGGTVGYFAVLTIAAPVFVAAALPLSIGGFGPREFAAMVAFVLIGEPAALGASAGVLYGLTAVVQGAIAAPLLVLSGTPDAPSTR